MTSMVVTYCKTNWMVVITPKCITKQTSSIFFFGYRQCGCVSNPRIWPQWNDFLSSTDVQTNSRGNRDGRGEPSKVLYWEARERRGERMEWPWQSHQREGGREGHSRQGHLHHDHHTLQAGGGGRGRGGGRCLFIRLSNRKTWRCSLILVCLTINYLNLLKWGSLPPLILE